MKKTIFSFLILLIFLFNSKLSAQWVQVPSGMPSLQTKINALITNGNNIFAGTDYLGNYYSSNNGSNWNWVNYTFGKTTAFTSNSSYMFEGRVDSGVYLSTNNGFLWSPTSYGFWPNITINTVAANGNYIYAGGNYEGGCVFVSTNNGSNWTGHWIDVEGINALAFKDNYVFAGSADTGVIISTNYGLNWLNTYLSGPVYTLIVNGNYIFAGAGTNSWNCKGVMYSTNNGTNWVQTSLNNQTVFSLAVSGNILFAGTKWNGVYISTDNGTTWMYRGEGLNYNKNIYSLCVYNNYVFAGTDSCVFRRPLSEFSTAPSPPVLLSPSNNSVLLPTTDTLKWNASYGATSYTVQLSFDPSFNNPIINDTGIISTYRVLSGLNYTVWYYWRVRAKNSFGSSGFSTIWNFSIAAPPTLIAPANHSTVYTPNPLFYWSNISIAAGYELQLSLDSTFNSGVHDTVTTLDSIRILFTSSVSNIHWRVRSHNTGGYGVWSSVWEFSVDLNGIILNSSVIPKVYKLYNNYPNPFNPNTTIKFDIPASPVPSKGGAMIVTLKIYDILGKEIASLIPPLWSTTSSRGDEEGLQPGSYSVDFNGSSLSSGIYFYKLITDKFTETKKMVLLK